MSSVASGFDSRDLFFPLWAYLIPFPGHNPKLKLARASPLRGQTLPGGTGKDLKGGLTF